MLRGSWGSHFELRSTSISPECSEAQLGCGSHGVAVATPCLSNVLRRTCAQLRFLRRFAVSDPRTRTLRRRNGLVRATTSASILSAANTASTPPPGVRQNTATNHRLAGLVSKQLHSPIPKVVGALLPDRVARRPFTAPGPGTSRVANAGNGIRFLSPYSCQYEPSSDATTAYHSPMLSKTD